MQNVNMTVKGKKLTIEIDLGQKGVASASGKSMVIASTKCNVEVPGAPGVKICINCYTPI